MRSTPTFSYVYVCQLMHTIMIPSVSQDELWSVPLSNNKKQEQKYIQLPYNRFDSWKSTICFPVTLVCKVIIYIGKCDVNIFRLINVPLGHTVYISQMEMYSKNNKVAFYYHPIIDLEIHLCTESIRLNHWMDQIYYLQVYTLIKMLQLFNGKLSLIIKSEKNRVYNHKIIPLIHHIVNFKEILKKDELRLGTRHIATENNDQNPSVHSCL